MKTITIQIGNSDDKLTQREWSNYVREMGDRVARYGGQIHFSGSSSPCAPWQNCCWVLEVARDATTSVETLRAQVASVGKLFRQESVAFTVGETEFV